MFLLLDYFLFSSDNDNIPNLNLNKITKINWCNLNNIVYLIHIFILKEEIIMINDVNLKYIKFTFIYGYPLICNNTYIWMIFLDITRLFLLVIHHKY